MFRVLLAAYMSLVLLAGQSVCCCTTMRALADLGAGPAEPVASGDERPTCCGGLHELQHGEDSTTADGQNCPSPLDEKRECPCHQSTAQLVAEARDHVVDVLQFRSIVPSPLEAASTVSTDVQVIAIVEHAQVANRASHFGTSTELRCALRTWLI